MFLVQKMTPVNYLRWVIILLYTGRANSGFLKRIKNSERHNVSQTVRKRDR